MSLPLISILIPTYNRADWLATALQSAVEQETAGRFTLEVIVSDNDSSDHTRETVHEFAATTEVPVKYVHATRSGDAQARNAGLPHCEGDWIAFMDDDELAKADWLQKLLEVALQDHAQLVGGAVHLDLPPEEVNQLSLDVRRSLRERSPDTCQGGTRPFTEREVPGMGNLLIAREVLNHLVEFDETVVSSDYDFFVRARRAGFASWFAPEAIIYHRTPETRLSQEFIDWDSYRSGAMLAIFDEKYGGRRKLLKWMLLRAGQGALVTFPKWLRAKITGNTQLAVDVRIRGQRLAGYTRGFFTLIAPRWFSQHSLDERIDFLKGRLIGKNTPAPPEAVAKAFQEPAVQAQEVGV
ncbi:glycosyltransferase family 2 protein [Adhaeretor mobilis]|uniref:GalNAc(5)-diNAcBac-PP-undecaprenol beta-1,3-glucosyltransferase n=1 Tax=Adhaeretor mobilis TaxID=1930276 RepID=A0A517MVU3_9BACT|nr:glycosyltransferase family 2 protein [Adhaeretor mobilis]QDS98998.1 GalNAc(5)-diNAcBac-PP-undecaprenol beta-1,3-glucosyltransferase [Adhaeretor mobilis]